MPDLSPLERNAALPVSIIHQLLGAGRDFPEPLGSYRRSIVRLADKAVSDYSEVRQYIIAQIEEMKRPPEAMAAQGRSIYMFAVSNRLEDCILTLRRLYRYYERVKKDTSGFPLDRLLRRRIENLEQAIRETRNIIEHLDADIEGGLVGLHQTTAPVLDAKTKNVTLVGVTLPVHDLANAIAHFHYFAQDFARYRRTVDGRYEHVPQSGNLGS